MTIDFFVPTGEVRQPKSEEWYQYNSTWYQCDGRGMALKDFPIGIRHQVEVPEDIETLKIDYWTKEKKWTFAKEINFPRPKVKIKKWQWVLPHHGDEDSCFMTAHFTDDEVKKNYPYKSWYHKIAETEIEVSDD